MTTQRDFRHRISGTAGILASLMLVLLMTACARQAREPGYSSSPEPGRVDHTETLTPDATTATLPDEALYQITAQPVRWFRWLPDGKTLVYQSAGDERYWAFSTETMTTTLLSPEKARELLKGDESGAFPLPDDAEAPRVAPSGERILFARKQRLAPTPTPGAGEAWGLPIPRYDIYVLERGDAHPQLVGQVDGLVERLLWLAGEDAALVQVSDRLPNKATLWIASLNDQTAKPLLPVAAGEPAMVFQAISPSGESILYSKGAALYVYQLKSGVTRQVNVPPLSGRAYYGFLTEQTLLIVDDLNKPLDFEVFIFDLEQGQICRQYPQLLRIHSIQLSPDRRYLALRWDGSDALYLLPITGCSVQGSSSTSHLNRALSWQKNAKGGYT